MSKIHTIRRRIKSVSKISQITKAMEKVAASKRRRAQEATLRSRPYVYSAREILANLYTLTDTENHPLFQHRPVRSRLIVLFSSDRGLAGPFNSNLFRVFLKIVQSTTQPLKVIVIGEKGAQFVSRLGGKIELIGTYVNWSLSPQPEDVRPIAQTVETVFRDKKVDQVDLLYTDFISTVQQKVTVQQLLPVDVASIKENKKSVIRSSEFEPSPTEVLAFVVPRLIEVQLYQASLESIASEQSMRMVAMNNASNNADELTDDLTLTYNSARQANITQELAEISAGVAAIK